MKRPRYKEEDFPEPGSVFVAPLEDGRFTVGRVLRREHEGGAMAVLLAGSPWIGHEPPPLDLPILRETLEFTHHGYADPRRWGDRCNLLWSWYLMPEDFRIIGNIELSRAERSRECNTYGGWQSIPIGALMQWRWDNDRINLLREEAEADAQEKERRRIAAEKRAEYMRTLTLDSLAQRHWLESWDAERATTGLTRDLLAKLVEELRTLPKLTSPAVRKLVQACVKELNRLDGKSQFIDTIEREDLCEVLEQILCAARQPSLVGQIDNWRKW